MAILEVRGAEFTYPGQSKPTLRIPEFTVAAGEAVFLHGPSGTGKTTFLEMMAGVLVPQKGTVRMLDADFSGSSASARDRFRADHLGYIFQSFNLIPYLGVAENIELPARFSARRRSRVKAGSPREESARLATALGIADVLDRRVSELSVGQQQRVAVARALIGSPELVLADEPTSALDQDHREKFLKLLFELARSEGTTIVFVSHDRTIQGLFSRAVSLAELQGAGS